MVEMVRHRPARTIPTGAGFEVLPRRWVVERTLSWLVHSHRLVRGYEILPDIREVMVLWSMTMLMPTRLANADAMPSCPGGQHRPDLFVAQSRATTRLTHERTPSIRASGWHSSLGRRQ